MPFILVAPLLFQLHQVLSHERTTELLEEAADASGTDD